MKTTISQMLMVWVLFLAGACGEAGRGAHSHRSGGRAGGEAGRAAESCADADADAWLDDAGRLFVDTDATTEAGQKGQAAVLAERAPEVLRALTGDERVGERFRADGSLSRNHTEMPEACDIAREGWAERISVSSYKEPELDQIHRGRLRAYFETSRAWDDREMVVVVITEQSSLQVATAGGAHALAPCLSRSFLENSVVVVLPAHFVQAGDREGGRNGQHSIEELIRALAGEGEGVPHGALATSYRGELDNYLKRPGALTAAARPTEHFFAGVIHLEKTSEVKIPFAARVLPGLAAHVAAWARAYVAEM